MDGGNEFEVNLIKYIEDMKEENEQLKSVTNVLLEAIIARINILDMNKHITKEKIKKYSRKDSMRHDKFLRGVLDQLNCERVFLESLLSAVWEVEDIKGYECDYNSLESLGIRYDKIRSD